MGCLGTHFGGSGFDSTTIFYGENEMFTLGFIGYGFVGKACHHVFKFNSEAHIVDPRYSTMTIDQLVEINPKMIFVSINAPTLDDRTVDASAIYTVFEQLAELNYKGIVVLKSTLPPDIVHDLYEKYAISPTLDKTGELRYVYSPEFLREQYWEEDAIHPRMIILAGEYSDCKEVQTYYKRHSHIKQTQYRFIDYREAALMKYTINAFLASKVVFMNQIYQLYCDIYGKKPQFDTWDEFTNILSMDPRMGTSHFEVPGPDGLFGYGGTCFPKDVKAMIGFDMNNRLSVLRESELANTKIRLTGQQESE